MVTFQVSNQLVRDRMQAEDVEVLESVKDTDIVCVRGTYDHIHLVLEAIEIPFSHVFPDRNGSETRADHLC